MTTFSSATFSSLFSNLSEKTYPICLFDGWVEDSYLLPKQPKLVAKWQGRSHTAKSFFTILDKFQHKKKKRKEGMVVYLTFEAGLVIQGIVKPSGSTLYGLLYSYDDYKRCTYITNHGKNTPSTEHINTKCYSYKVIQKTTKKEYKKWFDKAKVSIMEGDMYQVNLSNQIIASSQYRVNPNSLFLSALAKNPASYSAMLNTKEIQLVSSSPEYLFKYMNNTATTCPIGGTYSPEVYGTVANFLKSKKETAEHLMLVDLERNDISKIPGSYNTRVSNYRNLKKLANITHLESEIKNTIPNAYFSQLLYALFPGGSISGCPKRAVLKFIYMNETHPRDFYTGGVGYINSRNNFCFNILIRSMKISNNNIIYYSGSGVVYDSVFSSEWKEIMKKTMGFKKTIQHYAKEEAMKR